MLVGLVGGTEELQLKDEKQNINQIQSLWWINVLAIFFVKPQKKKKITLNFSIIDPKQNVNYEVILSLCNLDGIKYKIGEMIPDPCALS